MHGSLTSCCKPHVFCCAGVWGVPARKIALGGPVSPGLHLILFFCAWRAALRNRFAPALFLPAYRRHTCEDLVFGSFFCGETILSSPGGYQATGGELSGYRKITGIDVATGEPPHGFTRPYNAATCRRRAGPPPRGDAGSASSGCTSPTGGPAGLDVRIRNLAAGVCSAR